MQFHILSFEGPDSYAQIGGLGTRINGLVSSLAGLGHATHLWYVGDPALPGHESQGEVHLHRWCQWLSRHHPDGVYDGEHEKAADYAASLPPYLLRHALLPALRRGERAVIVAEEWHTVHAVLHLDWLLRGLGLRDQVTMLWNANNTFGFEDIPWPRLERAAAIATVSRYMKHRMLASGVDPMVIPNGLSPDAFLPPDREAVRQLRHDFRNRTVVTKMARWDPDKRWIESVGIVAAMKDKGWRPLLIARGGQEEHGRDVLAAAHAHGLKVTERVAGGPDLSSIVRALGEVGDADVLHLRSYVGPDSRRALFRASDVVLANSSHEPFGLVGLEAMAVGGIACTGCSGEDYALPGRNALVLQTARPDEFMGLYSQLRGNPGARSAMRRAGRWTARQYAWHDVIERNMLPWIDIMQGNRAVAN